MYEIVPPVTAAKLNKSASDHWLTPGGSSGSSPTQEGRLRCSSCNAFGLVVMLFSG
jgi:hypothetical protein